MWYTKYTSFNDEFHLKIIKKAMYVYLKGEGLFSRVERAGLIFGFCFSIWTSS
jgi:hypothetical protein